MRAAAIVTRPKASAIALGGFCVLSGPFGVLALGFGLQPRSEA